MKTIILCLGMLMATIVMHAQQVSHQLNLSTNDITIVQTSEYDAVSIQDANPLVGQEHAGKPGLPVMHINLLLPAGAVATGVNISGSHSQLSVFMLIFGYTINFLYF